MKILFCNNNIGGFFLFRYDIALHFKNLGHRVVLVYPRLCQSEPQCAKLREICTLIPVSFNPNGQNPLLDVIFFLRLLRIYKVEKPDIVFNYTIKPNIYSSIAAKLLHIKVVSMMAGLGYVFEGDSISKRLARKLYRLGLTCSNRVIVLNQNNYSRIVDKFVSTQKLILFQGGEGVNMETYPFRPNSFETTRFLMVARLLYDKGYKEFVDAATIVKEKYPSVDFEILGALSEESPTGVKKETLERDIASGRIIYLGTTSDVPSVVLRDGIVVVVASYYMEGMNRALMEACSMGRPIITTNMPGCCEMVDDRVSGYLVEPRNAQSLADACLEFLSRTTLEKQQIAEASYQKCKKQFDVKNVIREYDKIVEDLFQ